MDKRKIIVALDSAMLKVAEDEFARLTEVNSDPASWGEMVWKGLESLENLRTGSPPRYSDEWVALLYFTWYQPKQINLAYSIIKTLLEKREQNRLMLGDDGEMYVFDYGCGALATQFAMAIAVADALEQGELVSEIRISSYDPAQPMIALGNKMWEQFKKDICNMPDCDDLVNALCLIEPSVSTSECSIKTADKDNWLIALHAVYGSNWQIVKGNLSKIFNKIEPNAGFITSYSARGNLIGLINPFDTRLSHISTGGIVPQFSGVFHKISEWRDEIRKQIPVEILQKPLGNSMVGYYLLTNVDCQWRREACLVYHKD